MPKKRLVKTSDEIKKQIQSLEKEFKAAKRKEEKRLKENSREIKDLTKQITRLSKKHEMQPGEIVALLGFGSGTATTKRRQKTTRAKKASVAQYQNPNIPSQTWTGHGRKPGWFIEALEAGTSPESMAINNG